MTVILYKYNSFYRTNHQKSNKKEHHEKVTIINDQPRWRDPQWEEIRKKKNRILALE